MIPEFGTLLLTSCLLLSLLQAFPIKKHTEYYALATALCCLGAFFLLLYAFMVTDLSLVSVYAYSHTLKPLLYKITGAWGNHEGSLLLWVCLLSTYSAIFAFQRALPPPLKYPALHIQGGIAAMFFAFVLFTSNPFTRLSPLPIDGEGLNPLLQDIGLALHPPMLYLGYVGFSIVSSIAATLLFHGTTAHIAAASLHRWLMVSWGSLTLGITLGSWWAYRELGWGGFWFWDPVENVSLLPWLSATALIHALRSYHKCHIYLRWVILLALLTFIFSLMGTFLVRSGILTSVHAFASDPTRGYVILAMLTVTTLCSLFLFARKAPSLPSSPTFHIFSREGMIGINTMLLLCILATLLFGTLYPLLLEATTGSKIAVGAAYYNQTITRIALMALAMATLAQMLPWGGGTSLLQQCRTYLPAFLFAFIVGIVIIHFYALHDPITFLALFISLLLLATLFQSVFTIIRRTSYFAALSPSLWAMLCSHTGISILAMAIAISSEKSLEKQYILKKNDMVSLGTATFTLTGLSYVAGKNYLATQATLAVNEAGAPSFSLTPQYRFYPVEQKTTTEAAIHYRLSRNIYTAIGQPDKDGNLPLRIYYQPLINLIWLSGLSIALGSFLALFPRRKTHA